MRYEDWAKTKPVQQQFLGLYPGYVEPNTDIVIDGAKRRYREKLHMYVAEARFLVAKPPSAIDLTRLAIIIGLLGGLGGITVVLKSRALGVTVKPFIDAARVSVSSELR